jgi:hypothetical protein
VLVLKGRDMKFVERRSVKRMVDSYRSKLKNREKGKKDYRMIRREKEKRDKLEFELA